MRFDQPFIAIRERNQLEIFDLALSVVVNHFGRLLGLLILGALPWIVLDYFLTSWILSESSSVAIFYWAMFLLVLNQAQVGTMFVTHYLGQAMFEGRPDFWKSVKECFRLPFYNMYLHGVLRLVGPVMLLALWAAWDTRSAEGAITLMTLVVGLGMVVRVLRPYVIEVLLLEKTPVRTTDGDDRVPFGVRSTALHQTGRADVVPRFLVTATIAMPLFFSVLSSFVLVDSLLNIQGNLTFSLLPVYFTIALWLLAGYFAITRFLAYIDVRIRQEGWAVELRMRGQGQRLTDAMEPVST